MLKYDIEAKIVNSRRSRSPIYDKYRPVFSIHKSYLTSGEIILVNQGELRYGEESLAFIRFLTPEVYPKSIWVGKKIFFQEGIEITGYAIVTKIMNESLTSDVVGEEGELQL